MKERSWDVVGVGENSVDHIMRVPFMPSPEAAPKIQILESTHAPGGQVVTTLCTCAAMGLRAAYVGAFGSDEDAGRLRAALTARGVDLRSAIVRSAKNRSALILVDARNGDRVVMEHRAAALRLTPDDVPAATITQARVVHVDGVDEDAALYAAGLGRAGGAHVTCDLDHLGSRTGELLEEVTIPILAQGLPETLTGESDPERALRRLSAPHARLRCVTLGAQGALLLDGDRAYRVPAPQVTAVDTTGAGDVFRGAFIVALLRGDAPEAILRFANAAAALSCTRSGAIGGVPTLDEVETFLRAL